jgi:DNA-directed RNA polymerase subunit RPC12/RpoP
MVARSLSHVNRVASRNYTATRDQKLAYTDRANRLSSEMAAINHQVDSLTLRLGNFEGRIRSLSGRIARIRQGNFRAMTHLETDHRALFEEWMRLGPELRATVSLKGDVVRTQIQDLQQALTYRLGESGYDLRNLFGIESELPGLRSTLSEMRSSIAATLSPLEQKSATIDRDLARAETTLALLEDASFVWGEGETPIVAIRAKDLQSDLDGVITLTNRQFIFEHEREVVLKKTLFVVTEKKIVREVKVQKPIGMVTGLVQGKVGFFKGVGVFVEFAPEAGIPEMKFDTTDQDAEWVTKIHKYIISGQADNELAAAVPVGAGEKKAPRLVICPVCGAPYQEKTYRGQMSVQCKYCGARVSVQ